MTHAPPPWSVPAALCALALAAAAFLALWLARQPVPELPFAGEDGEISAERAYGELPLAFEPSAGRATSGVDFVSRSASGTVFLDSDGATLALGEGKRAEAIGLKLVGATAAEPRALERLPGVVNDLRGDDPQRWRTEIPTFERVRYAGVWPGIDLDYYGNQGRLEYDFRLAPNADPNGIAIHIQSAERLRLAANGDLLITAGTETVRQRAPIAYQPATGGDPRIPVRAAFALSGDTVGFRLGPYDHARPLVIDPLVLAYSTYLGGSDFGGDGSDQGRAIAIDTSGAAYVAGFTRSTDFDTVGAIQGDSPGDDAFVSKLNPAGDALEYSTYLGGDNTDFAEAIAVDATGAAYVLGSTMSTDFSTVGAIEGDQDSSGFDAFISKLTPAGNALTYSTYLGGDSNDFGHGIAVDTSGAAYVTGVTDSTDFNTVGAIEDDPPLADAFISRITPDGGALEYSTYLGGSSGERANGITVDASGAAYITGNTQSRDFDTVGEIEGDSPGTDVFVSKLTPAGSMLEYSTYLGGKNQEDGLAIAVDRSEAAYVTGLTTGPDFDTVNPIEGNSPSTDAFVSKLTPDGGGLEYSTYLGGNDSDEGRGIGVDDSGAAYVTGITWSTQFDTVGSIEGDSPNADAFVSKLTPNGSALEYSTYLGGSDHDLALGIAIRPSGAAYITGYTHSSDLDTVGEIEGDSAGTDAFVSKLTFCTITGTTGDDTLVGTPRADAICGLGGNDTIVGRRGDDALFGEEGNDVLIGSRGDDILDGGPGKDRADYSADATAGVMVNLASGVVDAANLGTDTIVTPTVERARGSAFADTLVGDGRANVLEGKDGDDEIVGGNGPDDLTGGGGADDLTGEGGHDKLEPGAGDDPVVSGGGGSDTLRYVHVTGGGVRVDLAAGIASPLGGSDSGTDALSADLENVVGSAAGDVLTAGLAGIASVLQGGDGADSLDTADGDALDSAKGGAGADSCTTDGGDQRSSCP